jgi:hypothetical protein
MVLAEPFDLLSEMADAAEDHMIVFVHWKRGTDWALIEQALARPW